MQKLELIRKKIRPQQRINREGKVYGKLTVIRRLEGKNYWECKCECGKLLDVAGQRLSSGEKSHCGCIKISQRSFQPNHNHPLIDEYLTHYRYPQMEIVVL